MPDDAPSTYWAVSGNSLRESQRSASYLKIRCGAQAVVTDSDSDLPALVRDERHDLLEQTPTTGS